MIDKKNVRVPFLGKRIVVITAHPDDEGLAAGTMLENHKAGGRTTLICATAGEKGKSHLTKPVKDTELKKIRKNELLRAAKILKIDEVIFFGFPDAGVRAHKQELFEKILKAIKKIQPDYILSFGPEGISAHWDHITVGEAAQKAAKRLKIPIAAFTLSPVAILGARVSKQFFLKRRKFGDYKGIPVHRKANVKVKIDATQKRKAMRSHVSQFGKDGSPFARFPKRIQEKLMGYEHFVVE